MPRPASRLVGCAARVHIQDGLGDAWCYDERRTEGGDADRGVPARRGYHMLVRGRRRGQCVAAAGSLSCRAAILRQDAAPHSGRR